MGVGRARHGVPRLACGLADERHVEHHVGCQQAQIALRRMVVVDGDLGHQPVQGQDACVVGDDQRRAALRQVLDTADLDPEPVPEEPSQQGQEDSLIEVLVEAELVDCVVARHPLADELGGRGDALRQFIRARTVIGRGPCGTAPVVDLTDDGRQLVGGCTRPGILEEGRMPTCAIGARRSPSLSRRATRIGMQRNDFSP